MVFDLNKMKVNYKVNSLNKKVFEYDGKEYYYKQLGELRTYYELIAHKIAERLALPSAPCYLTNDNKYVGISSESIDTTNYITMSDFLYTVYRTDSDKLNNLEDIWYAFSKKFDERTTAKLMDELVNIFLFDVLIGNGDRHNQNYGLIIEKDKVKFAPLFDHDWILYDDAIYEGEYHLSVSQEDKENSVYKFLNESDSSYTARLQAMLPVISDESLEEIFHELKTEGVEIPENIKTTILKKFAYNREMIAMSMPEKIINHSK